MNLKPDILACGDRIAQATQKLRISANLGNYRLVNTLAKQLAEEVQHIENLAEQARIYEEQKFKARLKARMESGANEHAN